jgi:hypothetical protein
MLSPLPRVYEEGHTGEATSTEEATLIGPDVQVERLTAAAKDLKTRLDQEVIQPIKQWTSAYRIIQVRHLGGDASSFPASAVRHSLAVSRRCRRSA